MFKSLEDYVLNNYKTAITKFKETIREKYPTAKLYLEHNYILDAYEISISLDVRGQQRVCYQKAISSKELSSVAFYNIDLYVEYLLDDIIRRLDEYLSVV